jgi:hypothetical protein
MAFHQNSRALSHGLSSSVLTVPAKHDDAVPAAGVLKQALDDLRFLKKQYL